MVIEIDQSGKIENTSKNTVIAFSNAKFKSIFISAKQEIRKIAPDFSKNDINFKRIGKKSRAHFLAYGVATGKKGADIEVGQKRF